MKIIASNSAADTSALRKVRGAFFTPDEITQFMVDWAIRAHGDRILEPSTGDAAFLVAAVRRFRDLKSDMNSCPTVDGVEIHADSATIARQRVREAGGKANIRNADFFSVEAKPVYDAVIGNPPYIRYQDFSGESRARSREAALRGGVSLTGLASSWAAFTVHSAMFLKKGGRLALVLPAELLSVNYASPVRQFLFNRFREVELVLFGEQVFPDAEADVVLLFADGYLEGPAKHATVRQSRSAADLTSLRAGLVWAPTDPSAKWTSSLVDPTALEPLHNLLRDDEFSRLDTWGKTSLGIVTGNNKYFTLSPQRSKELGLQEEELLPLSPPGSSHLRGLSFSSAILARMGREGNATYLFYPRCSPSAAALAYIEDGHRTGVDTAYKCRVRKIWYRVPLVPVADLLLTCMNADTPRLTSNDAKAHHLNSVHGVYLDEKYRELGCDLLPLASLNSVTLLHAEMVGRAYGGGVLKIEPREADSWAMPSPTLVFSCVDALRAIKCRVACLLRSGRLLDAVHAVDQVLLLSNSKLPIEDIENIRMARASLAQRRALRGASGR